VRPIVRSGSSILACPQHVQLGVNLGNADCPVLPLEGVGLEVIQTARGRTLRASDAEQHDRTMRSLSSGAHRATRWHRRENAAPRPGHERICSRQRFSRKEALVELLTVVVLVVENLLAVLRRSLRGEPG